MSDRLKDDSILARWLSNELSAEERRQVEADPDFPAWQAIVDGVDGLEPDMPPAKEGYAGLKARLAGRRTKLRRLQTRRRWIGIAASLLLLAGFFWWFNRSPQLIQTARVEQRAVELPDGSMARLKAESSLEYSRQDVRTVSVEGEVLLEVEKGPEPFLVESPFGSVEVLGTTFNVFAREGVLEVRCFSGRVAVYNAVGQKMGELAASDAIRVVDDEIELNYSLETGSWHSEERSSFQAVPLQRVMDELARIYDLTFVFDGSEIDTQQLFAGFFPHDDLETALGDVFGPMGIVATAGAGNAVRLEVIGD